MTVRNTRAEQLRRAGLSPSKVKDEKPPPPKTETKISLEIRAWLEKKPGALPTRVNSGKILLASGHWLHLAPKGTSDSLTLLPLLLEPYGWIGIHLAVKAKPPGEKPTPSRPGSSPRSAAWAGLPSTQQAAKTRATSSSLRFCGGLARRPWPP